MIAKEKTKKKPLSQRRLDGRQRTISEKNLWRSNSLRQCTAEDKYAIIYLLTSPFSGTTGTFEMKLSVAAAELGWDSETQFKPVLRRLVELGLIEFDADLDYVWIKIWWEHNVASQVAGERLIEKTINELINMPSNWLPSYFKDYYSRASEAAKKIERSLAIRGLLTKEKMTENLNSNNNEKHDADDLAKESLSTMWKILQAKR